MCKATGINPHCPHFVWQVNKSTSQVDVQVLNLKLDELELASLRGDLQEAALHVNFDTRMGRGAVNVTGPRFSGLQVSLNFHGLDIGGHVRTGLICHQAQCCTSFHMMQVRHRDRCS